MLTILILITEEMADYFITIVKIKIVCSIGRSEVFRMSFKLVDI